MIDSIGLVNWICFGLGLLFAIMEWTGKARTSVFITGMMWLSIAISSLLK